MMNLNAQFEIENLRLRALNDLLDKVQISSTGKTDQEVRALFKSMRQALGYKEVGPRKNDLEIEVPVNQYGYKLEYHKKMTTGRFIMI